jgi:hypothetical protein
MELFIAWLLRQMRRARVVFIGLYVLIALGFIYAEPHSGWTWLIVALGGLLCVAFWGLVGFWADIFLHRNERENGIRRDDG